MTEITVYAENAMELKQSNEALIGWCRGRLAEWEAKAKEQADALAIAKKNRWATSAINSALKTARGQCIYYHKMMSALRAGYTIVPAAWTTTIVGVRTSRKAPTNRVLERHKTWVPDAQPMKLAEGEGRYVGNVTIGSMTEYDSDDKSTTKYYADGFVEGLDFPAFAAKPKLMNAAQQAAAHKVFDAISVTDHRADPMLIGTVYGLNGREINFLIAWWLDTATL